jgi:serine/threonine protein kinase
MKIINKSTITCEEEKINTLSERFILEAMDHPFIVKLHYAFQSERKLYLLCDLMSGGELFYLLRRSKKFPEEVAKFYASEILLAIEYLHARNIIYRDLKPENILLDQHGHIKVTDFGLSKVCNSDKQITYSICGTPEYVAPEVMLGKGYSQTADWFSFVTVLLRRGRCCTTC